MKKSFASLLLLSTVFVLACTRDQVVTAITGARWGLSEACAQEYVTKEDCDIADSGLVVAIDVAKKAPAAQLKPDVLDVIKGINTKLPVDSKAKEFFDYLIPLLS